MKLQTKNFEHLIGHLEGFSETQLREHFGLYEGYVEKTNEILERMSSEEEPGNYAYSPHSELERRFTVAFNGVVLHELYFENLSNKKVEPGENTKQMLDGSWRDFKDWKADLKRVAAAGPGWVVLAYNHGLECTRNLLITEHHIGWPVGFEPILVLDMWEHAFMIDFKTDKQKYVDAFLKCVDWEVVEARLTQCQQGQPGIIGEDFSYQHATAS